MVRNSSSSDSGSHHSQLSRTVVGSPRDTPTDPCFPSGDQDGQNGGSTQFSPPPPCPPSNHPEDPLACPSLWDTPSEPVPGWPQVSELMSDTPEFASFNRFSDLQIRSLLYYQAEIEALKEKLKDEEWDDYRRGNGDAATYCRRAKYLVASDSDQWKIMKKIRVVLKEYNEALLQFSQVSALPKPESHDMYTLNKWLMNPESGNLCVGGNGEENTWGSLYETPPPTKSFGEVVWRLIWSKPDPPSKLDLASTTPKTKVDSLSRWAATSAVPWWADTFVPRWKKWWGNQNGESDAEKIAQAGRPNNKSRDELARDTLTKYSGESILRFTSSITTVVACLLPTIAITVLSQVHGQQNLLLCLAGFAVVFAAGLIFLGTASRVEIFGATAAFSAVLVVFISVPMVVVPPSGVPYVPNS